jgi:hypothetical protein
VGRACPTTGGKAPSFQIIFEYGKADVTCRLVGELYYLLRSRQEPKPNLNNAGYDMGNGGILKNQKTTLN